MREADRIECAAMGQSPKEALRLGLRGSAICLTATVGGVPAAMFGLVVTSALTGDGVPWLLGTDAVYGQPRAMLELGRRFVAMTADSTPRLANLVSAQNVRAIRYLRALGFEIEEQQTMHNGVAFQAFSRGRR